MFNPPPYTPTIHLSDSSQFGDTRNMNLGAEVRRRAAELHERRGRRAEADSDIMMDFESDDDSSQDCDDRGSDYDYEDRRIRRDEAVFFTRREADDLEIAEIERRVAEATRVLKEAKRELKEAKLRIRERRREERHSLNENVRMRELRDYLSLGRKKSSPATPQQLSLPPRTRSPSPYRFISRRESDEMPSQSVESRSRSRSRTLDPTGEGSEANSASQEQVYESFRKIHDLSKEFQTLKQNFVYPTVIDFQKPGSQEIITVRARSGPDDDDDEHVGVDSSVPEGKLGYTRTNEGLHTYSHGMEKVLGKLDSVDSWNVTSIRKKRRGVVEDIETEASKLEVYRQRVWREYCNGGK